MENGVQSWDFNSPLTHLGMNWRLCDMPHKPWVLLPFPLTPSSCSCRTCASCFLNSSTWIPDFCPFPSSLWWVPRWRWGCLWAFQASCQEIGALWSVAAHAAHQPESSRCSAARSPSRSTECEADVKKQRLFPALDSFKGLFKIPVIDHFSHSLYPFSSG